MRISDWSADVCSSDLADFLAAVEDYRFDMAAFAIAFDAFDLALDPHDACTLCNLAQIRGIKRGVEMKGMGDAVEARVRDLRQPREAVRARRRFVQRIVAEPPRNAFAPAPQPILRKLEHPAAAPDLRSEEHTS